MALVIFPYLNGLLVLLTRPAELPGELLEGHVGKARSVQVFRDLVIAHPLVFRIDQSEGFKIQHRLSFAISIA